MPPVALVGVAASSHSQVLTSDKFTGPDVDNIVGRTTDCLIGGTPVVWSGTAGTNYHRITSETLRKYTPSATGQGDAQVNVGTKNHRVSCLVTQKPTNNILRIMVRRVGGVQSYYSANLSSTGITMVKYINGTLTSLGSEIAVANGDRIDVEALESEQRIFINGVQVHYSNDTTHTSGDTCGFRNNAQASTGWIIDDVQILESV